MIRIRLHTPGWLDVGDDFRRNYEAASWEELQKVERIAGWASDPEFQFWCLSENHLMAEMQPRNGERMFWVIAYVDEGLEQLPLSQWVTPETKLCAKCGGLINSSGNCMDCYRGEPCVIRPDDVRAVNALADGIDAYFREQLRGRESA